MGRYMPRPGWQPGMVVQVTGDSRFDHERPDGTPVELKMYDPDDDSWEVKEVSNPPMVSDYSFWCMASDLDSPDQGPTDDEVAALFGLTEPKPCTTCGCPTNGKH